MGVASDPTSDDYAEHHQQYIYHVKVEQVNGKVKDRTQAEWITFQQADDGDLCLALYRSGVAQPVYQLGFATALVQISDSKPVAASSVARRSLGNDEFRLTATPDYTDNSKRDEFVVSALDNADAVTHVKQLLQRLWAGDDEIQDDARSAMDSAPEFADVQKFIVRQRPTGNAQKRKSTTPINKDGTPPAGNLPHKQSPNKQKVEHQDVHITDVMSFDDDTPDPWEKDFSKSHQQSSFDSQSSRDAPAATKSSRVTNNRVGITRPDNELDDFAAAEQAQKRRDAMHTSASVTAALDWANSKSEPKSYSSNRDASASGRPVSSSGNSSYQSLLFGHTNLLDVKGLQNLGNTCYMNAVLQALMACQPFMQDVLQRIRFNQQSSGSNSAQLSFPYSLPTESVLNQLIQLGTDNATRTTVAVFEVSRLKQLVGNKNPAFANMRQQDAHEFLMELFEQINYDCLIASLHPNNRHVIESPHKQTPGNITAQNGQSVDLPERGDDFDMFFDSKSAQAKFDALHDDNEQKQPFDSQSDAKQSVIHEVKPYTKPTSASPSAVQLPVKRENKSPQDSAQHGLEDALALSHRLSPITRNFLLELQSRITCSSCSQTRTSKETLTAMPIDMQAAGTQYKQTTMHDSYGPKPFMNTKTSYADSQSGPCQLSLLLNTFFRKHSLELKCSNPACGSKSCERQYQISKLPPVLIVHVKRFATSSGSTAYSSYTDLSSSRVRYTKHTGKVQGVEQIDLSPHCLPTAKQTDHTPIVVQDRSKAHGQTAQRADSLINNLADIDHKLAALIGEQTNLQERHAHVLSSDEEARSLAVGVRLSELEGEIQKLRVYREVVADAADTIDLTTSSEMPAPTATANHVTAPTSVKAAPERHKYSLTAAVLHYGSSLSSGHYKANVLYQPEPSATASASNANSEAQEHWRQYDDDEVMKRSLPDAVRDAENNGYLLFYTCSAATPAKH